MSTRGNILLQGAYADAFIAKAIVNNYVSVDVPEDEDFIYSAEDVITFEYTTFYKHNRHKSAVLQMFLLYDKVTLVDPDIQYDYSKLIETGLVDVVTSNDDPILLGSVEWDDSTKAYAMFLKPFVLNAITKDQPNNDRTRRLLKEQRLQIKRVYSALYDYWFVQDREQISKQKYLKLFNKLNLVVDEVYDSLDPNRWADPLRSPEKAKDFLRFRWAYDVTSKVGLLMSLLDLSIQRNAVLMQSQFHLSGINIETLQQTQSNPESLMESYQIVKYSLNEAIGSLPSLETIDDVLRLKDKRYKDIRRLIDVL